MNIVKALIGVLMLSIAGLYSTNLWEKFYKHKRAKYGLYLILLLFLLMLPGVYLSTYYWNSYFYQQDKMAQQQEMAKSLAAECFVNISIFLDNKFRDSNNDNMSTYVVYPRFRKVALESAIGSGLFVSEKDKELLTISYTTYECILEINNRLDLSQNNMIINPNPNNIAYTRKLIRDGKTLEGLRVPLIELFNLLIEDYGISEADTIFAKIENINYNAK